MEAVLQKLEWAALRTKQGEVERVSRKENWKAGQNADLQLFISGQREPHDMDLEVFLRLAKDASRVDSMISTLNTLLGTATELRKWYDKVMQTVASKLSKGISSLPDELLLLIFNFAAIQDYTTKTSIHISHVSRRFRAIALGGHSLWTTLHSYARKDELEAFIARSGLQSDLHVLIDVNDYHLVISAFMDVCSKTAHRWKSIDIIEDGNPNDTQDTNHILRKMDQYNLQLPRLRELHISHDMWRDEIDGEIDFATPQYQVRWHSPNLRILRSESYVPGPSDAFAALSSFSITISLTGAYVVQLQNVFSFLAHSPTISHLELDINDVTRVSDSALEEFTDLSGPSITFFKLFISKLATSASDSEFVRSFVRKLKFANLMHFSLAIEFRARTLTDSNLVGSPSTVALFYFSRGLFLNPTVHNRLTSMAFDLHYGMPQPRTASAQTLMKKRSDANGVVNERKPRTFTIHLDRIPHVSSLCLTTSDQLRVRFSAGEQFSDPVQLASSNLRELRLQSCATMDGTGLLEMVESLKDVGAWQSLERIAVEGCEVLGREEALDAIGRERLRYSKSVLPSLSHSEIL